MYYFKNAFRHLRTVLRHKYYVFCECYHAGIPWRGIVHDLSKFTPTEFIESAKYYDGKISPIMKCKEANQVSRAWLHHKGRNTHHYEYWQDNFDTGAEPLQMPFLDALEMLCDYIGAAKAYDKEHFSFKAEYEWWKKKKEYGVAMHPQTEKFIDTMLAFMAEDESDFYLNKHFAWSMYKTICLYTPGAIPIYK